MKRVHKGLDQIIDELVNDIQLFRRVFIASFICNSESLRIITWMVCGIYDVDILKPIELDHV